MGFNSAFKGLNSGFSIYFSWRNPKKAREITEEPLPVHNKSSKKLNTNMCWSVMYITCQKSTANLKLIDNLVVWPDTSNLYVAISADFTTESGSFWTETAIDNLRAISNGIITWLYYVLFFSRGAGVKTSYMHHCFAAGWSMWYGPGIAICFSIKIRSDHVILSRNTKCLPIVSPSSRCFFLLTWKMRQQCTFLTNRDRKFSHDCQVTTEGFGRRLTPTPLRLALVFPSPWQTS